jgi:uncharacterized protein DUF6113
VPAVEQEKPSPVSLIKDADPAPRQAAASVPAGPVYVVLALLGVVFGVFGTFHYSWSLGWLPLGSLLLVAANFAVCRLAGRGLGGKLGATVPWAGWMVPVVVLSTGRPEGDVLIAGDLAGYLFIVGGMVAGGIAIGLTKSARPAGSWLLRPGVRPLD